MTTICWDGRTLAADRKGVMGGTPVPFTKIWRINRDGRWLLAGAAGDAYLATAWRRWMEGGEVPPTAKDVNDLCVMVIDEKRRIWTANLDRIYARVTTQRWAIGSGCDYALGAMECGRTASQAVRVAMKLDNSSGIGVDSMRFR